jgi:hypothetical protein
VALPLSKIISILEDNSVDVDESKIDSAIQELLRRLDLYGNVSPFTIVENIISPSFSWKEFPEHTLCLYYSTYGAGNPDIGTKFFEIITQFCIEFHLNCNSYLLGFPASKPFKDQLDEFALLIREERHQDPDPNDKDRGVDIIAWKEFDEYRNNSILIFVQCAAGKHWNDKKPVAIESYRRYFSFPFRTAIPSLSITQIIDISDWQKAIDDYGIIIDRARLFRIITSENYEIDNDFKNALITWCEGKLS